MLAATPAMSLKKVYDLHYSEARLALILEYTNGRKLKHCYKWLVGQATLLPSLLRVHLRMVVPMLPLIDFAISIKELKVHGYRWSYCQMQEYNNEICPSIPTVKLQGGKSEVLATSSLTCSNQRAHVLLSGLRQSFKSHEVLRYVCSFSKAKKKERVFSKDSVWLRCSVFVQNSLNTWAKLWCGTVLCRSHGNLRTEQRMSKTFNSMRWDYIR